MIPAITVRLIARLGQHEGPFESLHSWWSGPGTEPIPMPRPDVLLLEGDEFGHAMLYRYTAGGEFGGDTWRERVEMAKHAAAYEYGEAVVGPWKAMPESESDAHGFAIRNAKA